MRAEGELAEVEAVLAELVEVRARCAQLVRKKERLARAIHATGVPKTGPNGVAPVIRRHLIAQGWDPELVRSEAVGVSDQTIRQAIERSPGAEE